MKAKAGGIRRGVAFDPARTLGGLTRPDSGIERPGVLADADMGQAARSAIIEGARRTQQRIDLSLELVDIQALTDVRMVIHNGVVIRR